MASEQKTITVDDVVLSPLESIYNYIRFDLLKDTEDDEKKRLFMKLFNVSLKSEKEIQPFVDALNAGNYKALNTFADKYAIDVKKELQKIVKSTVGNSEIKVEKINVFVKDPEQILNMYFSHSDPKRALNVLTHLVSLTFDSEDEFANYMKYFKSLPAETQGKTWMDFGGR
jgi:hypothetical protein